MPNKKAIVLLSGGMDSATSLFWALKEKYKCFCLIFDYSQRHKREINRARSIAKSTKCECKVLKINIPTDKSSLINKNIPLENKVSANVIPMTYVPGRNIIFLSIAASCAETKNADTIIIGTNQIDYSNYPDCRSEFIKTFQSAINKGTKKAINGNPFKILAPLGNKTKSQIVTMAINLGVPLELTWSCYAGGKAPCGKCASCILRAKGFREAGVDDPLLK